MGTHNLNWGTSEAPQLDTGYVEVLGLLRERDEQLARQFDNNGTTLGLGHIEGTIKYDSAGKKWQIKEAGSFVDLVGNTTSLYYGIGVEKVRGCHPSDSAGANNLSRNNNNLQNNLIAEYLGATNQDAAHFLNAANLTGLIDNSRLKPNLGAKAISGNSGSTTLVAITANNDDSDFYLPFVSGNSGNQALKVDSLAYNPFTNTLKTSSISSAANITTYGSLFIKETDADAAVIGNYIQMKVEEDTVKTGLNFDDVTCKSFIKFNDATSSNDNGYIMHETSNTEVDEGILHLVPSDNNLGEDSVWIHTSKQSDHELPAGYGIRLGTDGSIKTADHFDFLDDTGNLTISTAAPMVIWKETFVAGDPKLWIAVADGSGWSIREDTTGNSPYPLHIAAGGNLQTGGYDVLTTNTVAVGSVKLGSIATTDINITISTNTPTGTPVNGDIWLEYEA